MNSSSRILGLGIIGLGRAFMLTLPGLRRDPRLRLVAACTPSAEARAKFAREFTAETYEDAAALCADKNVDAVYIASPHQFHAEHAQCVAAAGKAILVEKPLALSLAEGQTIVNIANQANVPLIVGHSHSFDLPILHTARLIASSEFGRVRMIHAFNYTDFLYRPRRPEELDTAQGGGVVFSQAIHQIDCVRLLGGGLLRSVRAFTGNWDASRPTEGAYSALFDFADGAFASLSYNGYGRFDSDEFMGWIGELGRKKNPQDYAKARKQIATVSSIAEVNLKRERTYAHADESADLPTHHEHFGPIIVSCEHADLRPQPNGVMIYGNEERRFVELPAAPIPRLEVINELYEAVVHGRPPLHSGAWGLASLEAALAILQSAERGGETVELQHQVPSGLKNLS